MSSGTTAVNWVLWLSLASVPLLFAAWRYAWRGEFRVALWLLLIAGVLIRVGPAMDPMLHPWDERYHALVAKNMITDPFTPMLYREHVLPFDALSWTEGHVWLHKLPVPLWCMALSMKLFGVNEFALRLPSLILSTLGICVCCGIAKHFWGRRVGFVSAFLYSVQGAIIEHGSGRWATDHIDTFFTFFIGACVLCYLTWLNKRRSWLLLLSGILLGCALLSKWLPALVVIPVQVLMAAPKSKKAWLTVIGANTVITLVSLSIAAPWIIYTQARFPDVAGHEALMRMKHVTEVLDQQGGGILYYIDRLRMTYGEIVYLPLIWFMAKALRRRKNLPRWSMLVWMVIYLGFFTVVATKMPGYILPVTVPVLAITALFWVVLERSVRRWSQNRWIGYVVLVGLLALPVRYCTERLKPTQDLSSAAALKAQYRSLSDPGGRTTVVLGCSDPYQAMFYSDCIAYSRQANASVVDSLEHRGYRVIQFQAKEK